VAKGEEQIWDSWRPLKKILSMNLEFSKRSDGKFLLVKRDHKQHSLENLKSGSSVGLHK
jgi:hypothetical protein